MAASRARTPLSTNGVGFYSQLQQCTNKAKTETNHQPLRFNTGNN